MSASADTARAYRKWRALRPELGAAGALSWARAELAQRAMLARFGTWTFADAGYGTFAYADYESWSWGDMADTDESGPLTVRVLVGDADNGVDWGDLEPSDAEREHASAFYVALVVIDHDGAEIYHDGIGGIDVIDLPGYLQRDWEDGAAYALIECLDLEHALKVATTEPRERAYWAARDVETIG